MRAAATVVRLMPSPRNTITFFARPCIAPLAAARAAPRRRAAGGPQRQQGGGRNCGGGAEPSGLGVGTAGHCVSSPVRGEEVLGETVRAEAQVSAARGTASSVGAAAAPRGILVRADVLRMTPRRSGRHVASAGTVG